MIDISQTEFMTFTKEGSIAIYEQETLDLQKEASIFNLKSEDYLDLILIRSKEYIIFTGNDCRRVRDRWPGSCNFWIKSHLR